MYHMHLLIFSTLILINNQMHLLPNRNKQAGTPHEKQLEEGATCREFRMLMCFIILAVNKLKR